MMLPDDDPRLLVVRLRRELLRRGETDASLAAALRTGRYERPRQGAYVDGPTWRTLSREQQFAIRCRAAYLQAKTGVVLSHVAALPFHDAPLWRLPLDESHLTRDDGKTGRREAGVRQHRGKLLDEDVISAYGVRFTSAVRAALEVSAVVPLEPALVVVNDMLHRKLMTPAALRERYEREGMARWPHSLHTDLLLRLADPRIESVGESRTFFCLWHQELPLPVPQYEVVDGRGQLVAKLDFALPEYGVWLEFDGEEKYLKYLREGETVADAVLREKQRETMVYELTGWRCLRITWADLQNPRLLAARIRALIEQVAAGRARSAG